MKYNDLEQLGIYFGKTIEEQRIERKLTLEDMLGRVESICDVKTYRKIEKGTLIHFNKMIEICKGLGIEPIDCLIPLDEGDIEILTCKRRYLEALCWWKGTKKYLENPEDYGKISLNQDIVSVFEILIIYEGFQTMQDFCEYSGLSNVFLTKFLTNNSNKIKILMDFCDFFEMPFIFLFQGYEKKLKDELERDLKNVMNKLKNSE